jgi:hypothetical protein
MSTSAALALVVLVTVAICVAGIVVIGRARRGARGAGGDDLASREDTHRLLAENWALVEKTRETGMSEDDIARVRANLLGLDKG